MSRCANEEWNLTLNRCVSSVFVCLFFRLCVVVLSVLWYGSQPSLCQLPSARRESPHQYHVNRRRNWQAELCVSAFVCFLSQSFFFIFRGFYCAYMCVCAIFTPESVVSAVKWCVWVAIGWLVSLRGSSGSKDRCSGAAGGEPPRRPPAAAPPLWASSSERCRGSWEAAPGSWGPDAGKRCSGCREEGFVCVRVCLCSCVFCWGIPSRFVYQ